MNTADAANEPCQVEGNPFETARILRAFVECSSTIQNAVLEMAEVISNDESDDDDREMAFDAMMEALFPGTTADILGKYHAILRSPEAAEAAKRLRQTEESFAARVRKLMKDRKITQDDLGRAAGIGQSAVSNILTRGCRPQRRTVVKFAEALGVAAIELWPEFDATAP